MSATGDNPRPTGDALREMLVDMVRRITEASGRAPKVLACSPLMYTEVCAAAPPGLHVKADPLCKLSHVYLSHEPIEHE